MGQWNECFGCGRVKFTTSTCKETWTCKQCDHELLEPSEWEGPFGSCVGKDGDRYSAHFGGVYLGRFDKIDDARDSVLYYLETGKKTLTRRPRP
jgi:hypothetical protein